ncbi:MAG: GPI transamidase component [Thelocarpon superellum]|nr:MAG: GPI transamidase component [Thelocarpon superellum]
MPDGGPDDSSSSVAVSIAPKRPPPETAGEIRTRTLIILSFWAVVVFLGLPTWWKTTTIYRAKLPLSEMMDWADGRACRPVFPLQISVEAPHLPTQDASHLLRLIQHALDDVNDFAAHHLRLQSVASASESNDSRSVGAGRAAETIDDEAALIVRLLPGESGATPSASLEPYSPVLTILYSSNQIPSTSSTSSPLASYISNQLQDLFAEEQAMIAYLLSATSPGTGAVSPGSSHVSGPPLPASQSTSTNGRDLRQSPIKTLSPELTASLARRTTRSLKYSPTYHLTFSLFTPNALPSSWDIEAALEESIKPLLESLAPISNFTIDSQVQLYASFSPSVREPEFDSEQGAWTLRKEDLSGFINAAEWPLSPGIGEAPTVNFVLYVPAVDKTPLVVKENGGNSWLIPQWGGVVILNPPTHYAAAISERLTREQMQPALSTFSHQLLSLLGTPQTPSSLLLRLLTLTRVRAASLVLSASSTLGSLARLTLALPSISIPGTVATSVDRTISHLRGACADFRDGRFKSALQKARVAEAEAERGFFEKSMVGQVYFPDEHKVAVYLPLLGPVGVPLIMGALKEGLRLWREWKARRLATA